MPAGIDYDLLLVFNTFNWLGMQSELHTNALHISYCQITVISSIASTFQLTPATKIRLHGLVHHLKWDNVLDLFKLKIPNNSLAAF